MIFVVLASLLLGSLANGYGVFDQPKPPRPRHVYQAPRHAQEAPADTTEPEEPDTSRGDAVVPARQIDE